MGHSKIAALVAEHGPAIRVMAAIKRAIDPHNIMNPCKVSISPRRRSSMSEIHKPGR
ncbi:FAD-linked oxidase C-terminal domain-containing protein [Rhizobium sp. 11515TR]|uniref:FAD-linked oxidase C-terminal domain-containing protein n=1 Tax=Rhizobium sp. 11515TR TaxID=2028343 RepID=UPI000BA8CD54|nr:hypothetical protein CKA34_26465 [Rhizobium sp. 11515TR]